MPQSRLALSCRGGFFAVFFAGRKKGQICIFPVKFSKLVCSHDFAYELHYYIQGVQSKLQKISAKKCQTANVLEKNALFLQTLAIHVTTFTSL